MTDPEYSKVKIIVTTGDREVIFDLPAVENFILETNYEEPDIRDVQPKNRSIEVEGIAFTMLPKSNKAGAYMTITRSTKGVEQK